ncbi:MAG: hypothetical protein NT106_11795, partial [Candidatus Sumerlaeota bacterium]|nr:hypothetical protein [Candidatus Sumerlaeota bacterium]
SPQRQRDMRAHTPPTMCNILFIKLSHLLSHSFFKSSLIAIFFVNPKTLIMAVRNKAFLKVMRIYGKMRRKEMIVANKLPPRKTGRISR